MMNLKNYGQILEKSFNARIEKKEAAEYKKYSVSIRQLLMPRSQSF